VKEKRSPEGASAPTDRPVLRVLGGNALRLPLATGKVELDRVVPALTRWGIDLGRKRSVSFGRPALVELVPRTGLRVRGDAKMVWEVAGLTLPVTLRTWQLLLVPSIAQRDGALVLAFDPVIEELDFKGVPSAFDDRITDAINEGVASQRKKLSWNLSRLLGTTNLLPARVSSGGSLAITPRMARVDIAATELRIEIDLDAQVLGHAVATPRSVRAVRFA